MCRWLLIFLLVSFTSKAQQAVPVLSEAAVETQQEVAANSGQEEIPDPEQEMILDLNTQDVSELLSSPMLSSAQAQALMRHREKFGRLLCIEELQVIEGFDTAAIRKMRPFLRCGKPSIDESFHLSELLGAAHHELLIRSRRCLQDLDGFGSDGRYPFYQGDPNQLYFKYRMQAGRYFSAGIVMEKDAGEKLFSRNNGGRMDFFSWHVFMKPNRLVKTLVIGDYQIQFGQGLVVWKGMSLGKSVEVFQTYRRGMGIRPYASSGESGFNRGLAMSLGYKDWTVDLWSSYRKLDASLFPVDSTFTNFEVSSILESGLHRTYDEINRKALLTQLSGGVHLQFDRKCIRSEWTLHMQQYDFPLWPGDDPYEKYDADGKGYLNAGWAFRYLLSNASLYSEIAIDKQADPAIVLGAVFIPDKQFTVSIHYRNYSKAYQGLGSDGMREGSKTQNEEGLFTGIMWQVHQQVKVQAYLDEFHFPWLRYTSSSPAEGREWLTQITFQPSRTTEVYARFKEEEKPVDISGQYMKELSLEKKKNIRLNLQWMYGKDWEFQSRCEWVRQYGQLGAQDGIMFFQEFRYKPMGKSYSLTLRWSAFSTGGYESRIYTYEQDMAGSFSLPAYAEKGYRYYLLFRYRIMKGLDFWLRFSASVYPLSEGAEAGLQPRKDELKTQIRWQF